MTFESYEAWETYTTVQPDWTTAKELCNDMEDCPGVIKVGVFKGTETCIANFEKPAELAEGEDYGLFTGFELCRSRTWSDIYKPGYDEYPASRLANVQTTQSFQNFFDALRGESSPNTDSDQPPEQSVSAGQ